MFLFLVFSRNNNDNNNYTRIHAPKIYTRRHTHRIPREHTHTETALPQAYEDERTTGGTMRNEERGVNPKMGGKEDIT